MDVKKVVPSMTWKWDPIISFCVGESIRKVNLRKQTHNMSRSNDVRNKDITKVRWRIQTTVVLILRFVWISIWLLSHIILLEILHLIYLKCSPNLTLSLYCALIWSFRNVDLWRYKRKSKAIPHILCFSHWSGPNYFFHAWHINFWKPFQCKGFLCTLKHHCCLKYFIVNAEHCIVLQVRIIVIYYLGYWKIIYLCLIIGEWTWKSLMCSLW